MLASGSGNSYLEEFRRKRMAEKLLPRVDGDRPNLLTDRQAYISYLEVQLDRVTASCMAVQGFSDRIQQIQDHATSNESRLQNLTQEMHLGLKERDLNFQNLEASNKQTFERLHTVEERCKALESQLKSVMIDAPDIESQIHRIVKTKLESILTDNELLELKLTKLLNQRIDALCQSQSESERRLTTMMSNDKDHLESVFRNSEKHWALHLVQFNGDQDERFERIKHDIVRELHERMGVDEIQKARELQSRRLAQLQEQMTSLRPGITAHLNSLSEKLTSFENREVERDQVIKSVEARVKSAEQICSRIAHDTLKKVELHRQENLQRLNEMSSGIRNDSSFKVEMRAELRRWEEAMSTLIQNTERQIKKLSDSLVASKPGRLIDSNAVNENKKLPANGSQKSSIESASTCAKLTNSMSDAKSHPPWLDVLSKWQQHGSPRQPLSPSSSSTSNYAPTRNDNRNLNDYESKWNAIATTIEQLDRDCKREADHIQKTESTIKQLRKPSTRASESKRPALRRLRKAPEATAVSPRVLATSKKKLNHAASHRIIKR